MSPVDVLVAAFSIDVWDAIDSDEGIKGGPATAVVLMRKTYTGDRLVATSTGHVLTAMGEGGGAYLALERITGDLDGRVGTFVLTHRSTGPETTAAEVVTGSGTGGFVGFAATGSVRHGELTLELLRWPVPAATG